MHPDRVELGGGTRVLDLLEGSDLVGHVLQDRLGLEPLHVRDLLQVVGVDQVEQHGRLGRVGVLLVQQLADPLRVLHRLDGLE